MTKHFLSVQDLSSVELRELLGQALVLKARPADFARALEGRTLALIFQKPSTRTRVSFDVGMGQLGGRVVALTRQEMQLGRGETIADTAQVLSRYVDGIACRLFAHQDLLGLAEASTVPVINALTDDLHPCQELADLQTMLEIFGDLEGRKVAYVGAGNNVAHSLAIGNALLGVSTSVATPPGYEMDESYAGAARSHGEGSGAVVVETNDPREAVEGADVVYTDVWTSMGQEAESDQRLRDFEGFRVDEDLMSRAKPDAVFLHCLPLHRGEEVTAQVADGPRSRIFQQAENRLHAQKALLLRLLGSGG